MSAAGMLEAAALEKETWIRAAAAILDVYMLTCARSYAESLYETFVVEGGDHWTPQAAVDEDMMCWEK